MGKDVECFETKIECVSHLLQRVWQSFQIRHFGLVLHYFWLALLVHENTADNFIKVKSLGEVRQHTLLLFFVCGKIVHVSERPKMKTNLPVTCLTAGRYTFEECGKG